MVHAFRRGVCVVALLAIFVAMASTAEATSIVINTDATWLAKNSVPGAGWNLAVGFNTAADGGWQPASNNASLPCSIAGCMIWWDGQFSTTEQTWFRKTFFVDAPVTSALLNGGADDDATIWINGTIVYNVFDGLAGGFSFNIAPYLVPGNNLIAVFGDDNLFFGFNHQFTARLTIETGAADVPQVPEPTSVVLLGSGVAALAAATFRRRTSRL